MENFLITLCGCGAVAQQSSSFMRSSVIRKIQELIRKLKLYITLEKQRLQTADCVPELLFANTFLQATCRPL